jgi:hypothetical protein
MSVGITKFVQMNMIPFQAMNSLRSVAARFSNEHESLRNLVAPIRNVPTAIERFLKRGGDGWGWPAEAAFSQRSAE